MMCSIPRFPFVFTFSKFCRRDPCGRSARSVRKSRKGTARQSSEAVRRGRFILDHPEARKRRTPSGLPPSRTVLHTSRKVLNQSRSGGTEGEENGGAPALNSGFRGTQETASIKKRYTWRGYLLGVQGFKPLQDYACFDLAERVYPVTVRLARSIISRTSSGYAVSIASPNGSPAGSPARFIMVSTSRII